MIRVITVLEEKRMDSTLAQIAAGALVLHESAASIRARLLARQETLIRLRTELAALRSIIEIPPSEAACDPPERASMRAPTALMEAAVAEPALPKFPVVEPVVKARRTLWPTSLPIFCLIGTFFVITRFHVTMRAARPKIEASARVAGDDPALALVRQWHMPGDDKSLFERLGGVVEHPGGVPAWSAEMTDAGAYLVIFREAAGAPVYAFEADLASRTVLPTPEAAARLNAPPRGFKIDPPKK